MPIILGFIQSTRWPVLVKDFVCKTGLLAAQHTIKGPVNDTAYASVLRIFTFVCILLYASLCDNTHHAETAHLNRFTVVFRYVCQLIAIKSKSGCH